MGGIFKSKATKTLKKEVVIFITPRLIDRGDNPFSNSHNIISVEEERQMLSEAPAPPKELLQPARDLSKANIEHEHLHDPDPNR